jgi:hypothetical protein
MTRSDASQSASRILQLESGVQHSIVFEHGLNHARVQNFDGQGVGQGAVTTGPRVQRHGKRLSFGSSLERVGLSAEYQCRDQPKAGSACISQVGDGRGDGFFEADGHHASSQHLREHLGLIDGVASSACAYRPLAQSLSWSLARTS